MKKPILVVMAAGMGSRYGGLKQMDPVGPSGEFIIDYSLYDAPRAVLRPIVFIIKPENGGCLSCHRGTADFPNHGGKVAFQQLELLPDGYHIPEGRVKPWGTGHAILSASPQIDAPLPSSTQTTTTALPLFR